MENIVVDIQEVSYSYDGKSEALNRVSLKVREGSYVSIIGHNGSGKSTLAKLIMGLLAPKKTGAIRLFGMELNEKNLAILRPMLGIVFQNPDNQFIGSTVADDIAFGLENRQVPSLKMNELVGEFAKKVGMENFLDKEPTNLSGGQKQRVAIAGVLAMQPRLIIFDESTSMLDPKGKKEIREIIKLMKEENPFLTILSITHDIEDTLFSDQIIVLNEGKVVLQGTPKEVYAHQQELLEIDLDVPFIYKLIEGLTALGYSVSEATSLEEIGAIVCQ